MAEPGAQRTHQRGGVEVLPGRQGPGDTAVGPDECTALEPGVCRADAWTSQHQDLTERESSGLGAPVVAAIAQFGGSAASECSVNGSTDGEGVMPPGRRKGS